MTWLTGWRLLPVLLFVVPMSASCATSKTIPGTRIRDIPQNREIIQAVEKYRRAVEGSRIGLLMAMAHPHYYEHSGTPTGADDYGYKGLLRVIRQRISQLVSARCNMKYLRINWPAKNQAEVEVYISASFQLKTAEGERWYRMTDYNKLVLVKDKDRWLFIQGM